MTNVSSDPAADAMARTVLDYGDQALMVQCDSTAEVLAWTDALRAAALPGVVDVVPALRTVLVKLAAPASKGLPASGCADCRSALRHHRRITGMITPSSTSSTTARISPRSPATPA
ncbi:allophanate hydrolase subunit 1 [Mycobacterium kansasii]|uniref:Allophanate hydrolase subunit 1 n=1 Tax=Mycobacterium kansasii TaxID=1768 RepID=A0A1V3WQE2_MYCKA|nr:allophanate hydrolase subunit 1 [Mycobacterium kansasii]